MKTPRGEQLDLLFSSEDSTEAIVEDPTAIGFTEQVNDMEANEKLVNSPKRVLAIALQKKQEEVNKLEREIEQRGAQLAAASGLTARFNLLGFLVPLLIASVVAYGVYANYRAKTKIDVQYQRVVEQIKAAYRGNPDAHALIVNKIPELTKRRLPRTLKSPSGSSFVAGLSASDVQTTTDADLQTDVTDEVSVAEDLNVQVYAQPSEQAVVVGVLSNNSNVINLEQDASNPGWELLSLTQGLPVWISKGLLEIDDTSLSVVKGNSVNLRTMPSIDSQVLTQLTRGTVLELVSVQGDWAEVLTPDDFQLWITSAASELLASNESAQGPVVKAGAENKSEQPVPPVVENGVPVYVNPSEQAVIIGYLVDDSDVIRFQKNESNPGWNQVMLTQGFPAWISTTMLEIDDTSLSIVKVNNVNLRLQPSLGSQVLTSLNKGTVVRLLSVEGDWAQVSTPANLELWMTSAAVDDLLGPG